MLNNDLEKEKNKYLDMISMVHDYMHNVKSNILEVEILYYVAKELGIDDMDLYSLINESNPKQKRKN